MITYVRPGTTPPGGGETPAPGGEGGETPAPGGEGGETPAPGSEGTPPNGGPTPDGENGSINAEAILEGDTIYGGQGRDRIDYSQSQISGNVVYGNLGDDTITGGSGPDFLYGGQGNDVITGNGYLSGGLGDDVLNAGTGGAYLLGGQGVDTLNGGSGADTFAFAAGDSGLTAATSDLIDGFETGKDKIQLDIVGGPVLGRGAAGGAGYDAQLAIANELVSGGQANVAYVTGTNGNYLFVDNNGNGVVDMSIRIDGAEGGVAETDLARLAAYTPPP